MHDKQGKTGRRHSKLHNSRELYLYVKKYPRKLESTICRKKCIGATTSMDKFLLSKKILQKPPGTTEQPLRRSNVSWMILYTTCPPRFYKAHGRSMKI